MGQLFGGRPSSRRGQGSDVAGSRPYVPGDPISTIDWRASARLSTAHNRDEFVVRERYADEAPRVVVICDRAPSMALYAPPFPWLSKPAVVQEAIAAIVASAEAANSSVAYLEHADSGEPYWLPPQGRHAVERIADRHAATLGYSGAADGVLRSLVFLGRVRSQLSSGTFVFVISDFLGDQVPEAAWMTAGARRWEVVPVIVQDPTWEQSFPLVPSVILPLAAPDGEIIEVRLSRREAKAQQASNESRLETLERSFSSLGLDPVLLDSSDPAEIDRRFLDWSERRRLLRTRR